MDNHSIATAEVVDLFCGIGALSHGLKLAGLKILAGYDTDHKCKYAFETNNDAEFIWKDVSKIRPHEIVSHYSGDAPTVLAGCAPCQPFSTYKHRYKEDPRWDLVGTFAELATQVRPDFVTMENVPTLLRYRNGEVFEAFREKLESVNYQVFFKIARCEEFGVPQRRRRLVVIASRTGAVPELEPLGHQMTSVRTAIGELPMIDAGQPNLEDPLHIASALSALNQRRIRASRPGGTWRDWPMELRADCHKRDSGKTYPGVYARMAWDKPSPTMTTQCYGYGNGRFGHPEQNRAISLREAAILQSFPPDYQFLAPGERPAFTQMGRWIGNAVPVKLAQQIGKQILANLSKER